MKIIAITEGKMRKLMSFLGKALIVVLIAMALFGGQWVMSNVEREREKSDLVEQLSTKIETVDGQVKIMYSEKAFDINGDEYYIVTTSVLGRGGGIKYSVPKEMERFIEKGQLHDAKISIMYIENVSQSMETIAGIEFVLSEYITNEFNLKEIADSIKKQYENYYYSNMFNAGLSRVRSYVNILCIMSIMVWIFAIKKPKDSVEISANSLGLEAWLLKQERDNEMLNDTKESKDKGVSSGENAELDGVKEKAIKELEDTKETDNNKEDK